MDKVHRYHHHHQRCYRRSNQHNRPLQDSPFDSSWQSAPVPALRWAPFLSSWTDSFGVYGIPCVCVCVGESKTEQMHECWVSHCNDKAFISQPSTHILICLFLRALAVVSLYVVAMVRSASICVSLCKKNGGFMLWLLLLLCCCYGVVVVVVVVTMLLVCFCGGQSRWMDMPQRANVPSKPPGPHRRHPLRNINFLSPSHIRIENSGILRTLTISSSAKVGWLTQRIGQRARTEEHSAKLLVSSTAKTEAPFWRPFGGIAHDPRE